MTKNANLRLGLNCNQNCLFCTIADDPDETLSTHDAKNKIDELTELGVTNLCLTGGEPSIRKDFIELSEYASKKGLKVEIQTNGTVLCDNTIVERIKELNISSILVALHSHKKEISNKITNSKDYEKTIQAINNIISSGIPLTLSHVVCELNYKDLVDYIDFVKKWNCHLYFGFIRPNGNVTRNQWLVPKLSHFESYLIPALDLCSKYSIYFTIEGVPLCYMGKYVDRSSEKIRFHKPAHIYIGTGKDKHNDIHNFIRNNLKRKSNDCKLCIHDQECPGVWKKYAQIYSTDELYPIFEK